MYFTSTVWIWKSLWVIFKCVFQYLWEGRQTFSIVFHPAHKHNEYFMYLWFAPVLIYFFIYIPLNFIKNLFILRRNYLRNFEIDYSIFVELRNDLIYGICLFFFYTFYFLGLYLVCLLFKFLELTYLYCCWNTVSSCKYFTFRFMIDKQTWDAQGIRDFVIFAIPQWSLITFYKFLIKLLDLVWGYRYASFMFFWIVFFLCALADIERVEKKVTNIIEKLFK